MFLVFGEEGGGARGAREGGPGGAGPLEVEVDGPLAGTLRPKSSASRLSKGRPTAVVFLFVPFCFFFRFVFFLFLFLLFVFVFRFFFFFGLSCVGQSGALLFASPFIVLFFFRFLLLFEAFAFFGPRKEEKKQNERKKEVKKDVKSTQRTTCRRKLGLTALFFFILLFQNFWNIPIPLQLPFLKKKTQSVD